jgi:hypothetical protein
MVEMELPNPEEIEEKRHDGFTKRVALATAIIAVGLAITSVGGNNAAKEMMHEQIETSNTWAHYQAKSIREKLCEIEAARIELDLARLKLEGDKPGVAELRAQFEAKRDAFIAEKTRYRKEKDELDKEARRHDADTKLNQRKDGYFDVAEVLLQISIVMASIAMLATSMRAFGAALAIAVLGVILSINGFGLFFSIGFLEPSHQGESHEASASSTEMADHKKDGNQGAKHADGKH